MTERVAAFLKGINVGGNKKIDMEGLRRLISGLGCGEVRTHLQSGNCVFTCKSANLSSLGSLIEEAIQSEYGFGSRVILRKAKACRLRLSATRSWRWRTTHRGT